jgi:hypothetical protein
MVGRGPTTNTMKGIKLARSLVRSGEVIAALKRLRNLNPELSLIDAADTCRRWQLADRKLPRPRPRA